MMPGTLIDGVIADAAAKNLIPDLEKDLFQAMLETAEKEDPSKRYGRQGASDYQTLGYLPFDYHESVSHSLDYSYSDFCIASLANKLQQEPVAEQYSQQSLNYQTFLHTLGVEIMQNAPLFKIHSASSMILKD